jgi:hypothetical protein
MPCPVPIWRHGVWRTHLSEPPFDVALASPSGSPLRQFRCNVPIFLYPSPASLMNAQHRARCKWSGRCRDQEGQEDKGLPASAATSPQPRLLAEHNRCPQVHLTTREAGSSLKLQSTTNN